MADLEVGLVFELGCGLSLGIAHVTRTAEFEGQPEAFNFGAVHIGYTF